MVTINDVAEQAGVSNWTVSKVINGAPSISEVTRKKVIEAISALNYVPNESARRLKSFHTGNYVEKKTRNIGCVFFIDCKFSDPFYSVVLEGVNDEIFKQKYNLRFTYTFDQFNMDPLLLSRTVTREQVDGLLLIHFRPHLYDNDRIFSDITKKNIPVVCVDSSEQEGIDSIDVDKVKGGYEAVKYLAGMGHKRIAFIGNHPVDPRFIGYRMAFDDLKIEYDERLVMGKTGIPFDFFMGYNLTDGLFKDKIPLPTAIFGASDTMALGAMRSIQDKGLNVPRDISIIGFDDINVAQVSNPALTTFKVNKAELGALAVRRLLERIHTPGRDPSKIIIPVELVERESCRRI